MERAEEFITCREDIHSVLQTTCDNRGIFAEVTRQGSGDSQKCHRGLIAELDMQRQYTTASPVAAVDDFSWSGADAHVVHRASQAPVKHDSNLSPVRQSLWM